MLKCKKGFKVEILKSGAGYYLGTLDNDGFPQCRLSTRYAATEKDAQDLSLDRQFGCIENEYCNSGTGCFEEE